MKPPRPITVQFVGNLILACGVAMSPVEARQAEASHAHTHEVTFELTFDNCDLTWLGDPGSPTSLVYINSGAEPVATDLYVRTLRVSNLSPQRHYLSEARIVADGDKRLVYAFTPQREQIIGVIDKQGRFLPNEFYGSNRRLLTSWPLDASVLEYDVKQNALYRKVDVPGPALSESLDFLPLQMVDTGGTPVTRRFSIQYATPNVGDTEAVPTISLLLDSAQQGITLATATLPRVFRRDEVQLGSFDNLTGTYLPESVYRPGADEDAAARAGVTFSVAGKFTSSVDSDQPLLVLVDAPPTGGRTNATTPQIKIDGNFDDWRNVAGVDDPRGDLVPYLEYVPDVDLLEFKVAHDIRHIYLYARVAGQVGRSHPDGGRSYFYAYLDVDRDPGTGFLPSRDDDCYFGVDLGDDCEVQFEFVDDRLRKTFYGFCGLGGNDNVLKQIVTLGKSQYGRYDERGAERANYKAEYIYRDGATEITEDLKLGTSDTIQLAISPDGREVEVVSTYSGFLKNSGGQPTVKLGQQIDLAVGMECDSKAYLGKTRWAADSTMAIRGYELRPIGEE